MEERRTGRGDAPGRRGSAGRGAAPAARGQVVALNEYGDGELRGKGWTVRLARTAVGDQVSYRPPERAGRFGYGDLLSVDKPGPGRVDPGCAAYAAGCGGCQWLHLDYAEQLRWKARILREILAERCRAAVRLDGVAGMDRPEAYRNKLSLRALGGRLVQMQEFGGKAVQAAACKAETPANQAARAVLAGMAPPPSLAQLHLRSAEDGGLGACLFARRADPALRRFAADLAARLPDCRGVGAQTDAGFELLAGVGHLEFADQGLRYRIPLNGFFQTNYGQARRLRDLALAEMGAGGGDSVLDLYCGCGFFSLPLAQRAGRVLGIENNAASTANAAANAALNGLAGAEFRAADAAAGLADCRRGDWGLALLDPPRQGCDAAALAQLVRLAPRRIVYVSCLPSSLARDLKTLMAAGYRLARVQAVDMFPHTAHLEAVATLER